MLQGTVLTKREIGKILAFRADGKTQHQITSLVKCSQEAIKSKRIRRVMKRKKSSFQHQKTTKRNRSIL